MGKISNTVSAAGFSIVILFAAVTPGLANDSKTNYWANNNKKTGKTVAKHRDFDRRDSVTRPTRRDTAYYMERNFDKAHSEKVCLMIEDYRTVFNFMNRNSVYFENPESHRALYTPLNSLPPERRLQRGDLPEVLKFFDVVGGYILNAMGTEGTPVKGLCGTKFETIHKLCVDNKYRCGEIMRDFRFSTLKRSLTDQGGFGV